LKHEVSYRDVYDRIHKDKDGEYISRCSKKFMVSYFEFGFMYSINSILL